MSPRLISSVWQRGYTSTQTTVWIVAMLVALSGLILLGYRNWLGGLFLAVGVLTISAIDLAVRRGRGNRPPAP